MERFRPEQRLQIVRLYFDNRNVFIALGATYGLLNRLTERTIRCNTEKFETQFSLLDNRQPNRPHPARSEENSDGG